MVVVVMVVTVTVVVVCAPARATGERDERCRRGCLRCLMRKECVCHGGLSVSWCLWHDAMQQENLLSSNVVIGVASP